MHTLCSKFSPKKVVRKTGVETPTVKKSHHLGRFSSPVNEKNIAFEHWFFKALRNVRLAI
eukprot:UN26603